MIFNLFKLHIEEYSKIIYPNNIADFKCISPHYRHNPNVTQVIDLNVDYMNSFGSSQTS